MRVVLVDVSGLFWASWYSSAGEDIAATVHGTLRRVSDLAHGHDVAIACLDAGTHRKTISETYKANRPPKDAVALEHLRKVVRKLRESMRVTMCKGYEADDVIATLATQMQDDDEIESVEIASADKDLWQLVGGKIYVRNTRDGAEVRAAEVMERFGVLPPYVHDWLSLVGDASDNIKGCPGVGPKTATTLLSEHTDIDGIYRSIKQIPGKVGISLMENEKQITLAYQLVALKTDLPIDAKEIVTEQIKSPPPPEPEQPKDPPAKPETEPATDARSDETRIAKREPTVADFARQLEPPDMRSAFWFSERATDSRLFGHPTAASALMAVVAGREMGIGAVAALRGMYVAKGHLTLSAQLMAGVILRSGLAEYFEPVLDECDDEHAVWETKRKGSNRVQRVQFTIDEARRAGLSFKSDSNWTKWPKTMLRWRACSELARAIYPDVVGNVYTPADFETEVDIIDAIVQEDAA